LISFDKERIQMNRLIDVWAFLNDIKVETVKRLPEENWIDVKLECDDLFRQASGGVYKICPAWFISL
jgi:hypothetical protein